MTNLFSKRIEKDFLKVSKLPLAQSKRKAVKAKTVKQNGRVKMF